MTLSGAVSVDLPGGRVSPSAWSPESFPSIPLESISTTCVW